MYTYKICLFEENHKIYGLSLQSFFFSKFKESVRLRILYPRGAYLVIIYLIFNLLNLFTNMRRILEFTLSFLIMVSLIASCEQKSEDNPLEPSASIDFKNPFTNKIAVRENGKLLVLSEEEFTGRLIKDNNLDKRDGQIGFENYRIEREMDKSGQEEQYVLRTSSTDGRIDIGFVLTPENDYLVATRGCKCETDDCAYGNGCNVANTFICSCTSCDGDCKKTSTRE